MNGAYKYHVYGLKLSANQLIPGLVSIPSELSSDMQVWLGWMPPRLEETPQGKQELWYVSSPQDDHGEPVLTVWKDGACFRLRYSDSSEFFIDRLGTQLWATWPDTLSLEDTATYLLGPVLGFVLLLRGITCLHASAIAIEDRAIGLLGPAGAGKSTTAAAFAKLGYPVLSDDLVPLRDEGNIFTVLPGYPWLRLWPTSVEMLYGSPDVLPLLTPNWDKRYLDTTASGYQFCSRPLPLAAIYILGERCDHRAAPFIESVTARAGLISMVANTYANRLLDKKMRAQEFCFLSKLVTCVPIRRVTPHADPAYLARLCDTILDDFRLLDSSSPGPTEYERVGDV